MVDFTTTTLLTNFQSNRNIKIGEFVNFNHLKSKKMQIEISEQQVSYIKSLDSKNKQRKFLLNCLVEQITSLGESVKISELPIMKHIVFKDGMYKTNDVNEIKFLNSFCKPQIEIARDRLNHTPSNADIEWTKCGLWYYVQKTPTKNNEIVSSNTEKPLVQDELLKFDTMEEPKRNWTVFEIIKESNYFKDMLENCFKESRLTHPMVGFKHETFAKYLDSLEKQLIKIK